MRRIDTKTWSRRKHFETFSAFEHPHFSLCANVDVTSFHASVKQQGASFTVATAYVLARAANAIPEFRQRIRADEVVEHDVVHPSITILTNEDLFSFCAIEYSSDFPTFAGRGTERIARVQEHPTLADHPGQDDLLFMTAIPWVSFTAFMHPLPAHPADSVPRFAWGRFFEYGDRLRMPLNVEGHHALMDGIHVGRFYADVQGLLDRPEVLQGDP